MEICSISFGVWALVSMIQNIDFYFDYKERPGLQKKNVVRHLEAFLDADHCQTLNNNLKHLKNMGVVQKQKNWVPYELKTSLIAIVRRWCCVFGVFRRGTSIRSSSNLVKPLLGIVTDHNSSAAEPRIERTTTGIHQKTRQGYFPALQRFAACFKNRESKARDGQVGYAILPALFLRPCSFGLPLVSIHAESSFDQKLSS